MEIMIRKITAVVCALVMVFTLLAPIGVNAERIADCWKVGTKSANAKVENGILTLDGTDGKTASYTYSATYPKDLVLKFSARILQHTTMGVQFHTGTGRAGMYMNLTGYSSFGGAIKGSVPTIGNAWHDYRIEVIGDTQSIYVDGELTGTGKIDLGTVGNTRIYFWTNPNGKMEIGHWSLHTLDGRKPFVVSANYAGEWLPGEDYTPGFTQDWKTDTGNWHLTDAPAVEWIKERGVIRIDSSKGSNGGYYPVQHALNLTKNFDWKWKWRIIKNTNSSIQIKFYGDYLNLYFYVRDNEVLRGAALEENLQGNMGTIGMGINVRMGQNMGDWCEMELQRRGDYLSMFVDGGKVKTWRAYSQNSKMGMIALAVSGHGDENCDIFEIGETSYTPYFPTVEMEAPLYNSEFVQSSDVVLRATATEETDYIDYYVDDLKIGRGYAPTYEYTLENVQPGTYNVSAGIGDQRSVATVMHVKAGFTSALNLSADEIKYGGTVNASITSDALNSDVDVSKVEYYVNGELVATATQKPFKATLKNFEVGTASVYAKIMNKQNVVTTSEIKLVDVYTDGKGSIKFNREYDMSYKYDGGTGKVTAEDGYFKLDIEHNGNILKYLDQDGKVKEYSMTKFKDTVTGLGDYRVITTSGFAEVYYNGQMLHTFYMPATTVENKLSYSGIKNFKMTGRGCKYTLFSDKWPGTAEYTSPAINMGTIEPLQSANVYTALEFDKTDLSDEVFEYFDGRYQIKLTFKDGELTVRDQGKQGQIPEDGFPLERKPGVGYYRVNVTEGAAQVWCNNKYVGSFMGVLYAHKPQIIRTMTNPSASTFVAVKSIDDIYYHSEDFSGNKELIAMDYWVTNGDTTEKINQDEETGKYHATVTSATEGRLYLNAFTKDVIFNSKVKVDSAKKFYIMTRQHPIYYDFKLGYDFEAGQYFAEYNVFGGEKKSIGKDTRSFPGTFELGKWHDVEVINKEKNLVMKVDGKTVIDTKDFWLVLAGTPGFGVVGGTLHFTDVYYEGRAKVGSGTNGVHDNEVASYNDFVQMKDGRVVSTSTRGGWRYTSDGGKTWTDPQGKATAGGTTNILVTKEGNWVGINSAGGRPNASISTDEGQTWGSLIEFPKNVDSPNCTVQNNFSNVAKNGRLLVTSDELTSEESGQVGAWWSDDGGLTWTESDTYFQEVKDNVNGQEASFVDMPTEGHYRIFFRTDRNYIYFAESFDDCKTFETRRIPSPFKATCCTFKIRRDTFEDQTYYALWTYDVEASWQRSRNEPRNRVALAVSYDGMETWEFVQTIFDTSDYPNGLVRNYSLEIMENEIYISMNGNKNDCFLQAIDKSKIKTTKRFEEAHPRGWWSGTLADDLAYTLSVIPNKDGQAYILGNYEEVKSQNGMVKAETLAKAFNSVMTKNGNTVTFKIGDGYVKFTDGSSSYDVNGTSTDFGSTCMKDGYIDINACAKAFGKPITENEAKNGWVLWSDAVYAPEYKRQLEGLI